MIFWIEQIIKHELIMIKLEIAFVETNGLSYSILALRNNLKESHIEFLLKHLSQFLRALLRNHQVQETITHMHKECIDVIHVLQRDFFYLLQTLFIDDSSIYLENLPIEIDEFGCYALHVFIQVQQVEVVIRNGFERIQTLFVGLDALKLSLGWDFKIKLTFMIQNWST